MQTEDISLVVDGQRLRGFQQVNISRSMRDASIRFGLRATNPAWSADAFAVRFAQNIEIYAGGVLMVRGQVDDYEADEEGESREVRISGTSKSALAHRHPPIKHKTGRIEGKTLLEAARELDELGVGIEADIATPIVPLVQRHPMDTVWATIERYARPLGLMLTGQPDGKLLLTRGTDKRHAGRVTSGFAPLKKIKIKVSTKNRASQTVVRGQRRAGVTREDLRLEQQVFDPSVGGFRPAIIFSETDQDQRTARNRAEWQRLRQGAFGGLSVSATVFGWRDEAGEVWEPGRLIFVSVPGERVEQDMRLESVTFTQDHKGTISELTLVDPNTTGKGAAGGKAAAARNKSDKGYQIMPPMQGFE